MKVGIAGSGGVGGVVGAFLADAGVDVAFLARGAHGKALRERGLRFDGQLAQFSIDRVTVSERGRDLGRCDVVFVGVKTWHLSDVLPELREMVGDGTIVVPLLNGIGAWGALAKELGEDRVVGGIIYCNTWVESPGVIKQLGTFVRVVVGERTGGVSPRLAALAELLKTTPIQVELEPNVVKRNWDKFLGFEPMALIGVLSRSTIGRYRAIPEVRAVLVTLMKEVFAIGRRLGVALTDDAIECRMEIIDGLAMEATISMQRDIMAGRRSEFAEQSLGLVELARSLGVPTPMHDICVPLVHAQIVASQQP